MRLLGGEPSTRHGGVAETVFLHDIRGRLTPWSPRMPIGEDARRAAPSPLDR